LTRLTAFSFLLMAHFVGSSADGNRARTLAKKREEERKEYETNKTSLKKISTSGLKEMDQVFSHQNTTYEDQFKQSTVGLVSFQDFKNKRKMIEKMVETEEKKKQDAIARAKKQKRKDRAAKLNALSFDPDEVTEVKSEEPKKKVRKDPTVPTHFLPDKDREAEEESMKSALREEFQAEQEIVKAEMIEVTYSYWDGSGHRRSIKVNKGCRIDQFLEKCRRDLSDEFHEVRGMSAENLMYIKEDLIIPHQYSFFDLIITKARGKSGPLFHFDVHDDIRLLADASVEKDESHAGKIVSRAYYERNQHVFPCSRWEVYDPTVERGGYTIKGGEINGRAKV